MGTPEDLGLSMFLYGDVVQLVEHLLHTETVGGSNPSFTTKDMGCD